MTWFPPPHSFPLASKVAEASFATVSPERRSSRRPA